MSISEVLNEMATTLTPDGTTGEQSVKKIMKNGEGTIRMESSFFREFEYANGKWTTYEGSTLDQKRVEKTPEYVAKYVGTQRHRVYGVYPKR